MKNKIYITAALLTALLTGCLQEESPFTPHHLGKGQIALDITADGKMETRAEKPETEEQKDLFLISILKGNSTLVDAKVHSQLTTEDLTVPVGNGYSVMAESCSLGDADTKPTTYGQPRLVGTATSLTVTQGETTTARIHCTPANAGIKVSADEDFLQTFSSYEMQVVLGERKLTFTPQNEGTVGYFNVPASVTCSLTAVRRAGGTPATASPSVTLEQGKITSLTLHTTGKGTITLGITYDDSWNTEYINLIIDLEEDQLEADPSNQTDQQL